MTNSRAPPAAISLCLIHARDKWIPIQLRTLDIRMVGRLIFSRNDELSSLVPLLVQMKCVALENGGSGSSPARPSDILSSGLLSVLVT